MRSPQVRESSIQSILIMAFHFTVQKKLLNLAKVNLSASRYISQIRGIMKSRIDLVFLLLVICFLRLLVRLESHISSRKQMSFILKMEI